MRENITSPRAGGTGVDRGFEARLGVWAAREWADDRHVDPRLPVRVKPCAALLGCAGNAGRIDHRIAYRLLRRPPIAARPSIGDRSSLGGKAMCSHQLVVAGKEPGVEGQPWA